MAGSNEGALIVARRPCTGLLTGRQLLLLQLLHRGYARPQLAAMLSVAAAEVAQIERSASVLLGVSTVEEAVELARRRRLIV